MKKFVSLIVFFGLIVIGIIYHSVSMVNFGKTMNLISEEAIRNVNEENWETLEENINTIEKEWRKKELWTALTMKTDELEEIEISLKQSKCFAQLRKKDMFLGEFVMFQSLVNRIPDKEGAKIKEIF